MSSYSAIASRLGTDLGAMLDPHPSAAVHGGCIAQSFRWHSSRGDLFVKLVPLDSAWVLNAEADGLRALSNSAAVRVPRVLARGSAERDAYLALEWLDLLPGEPSDARLGESLAALHRSTATTFGWHRDNAIGAARQLNTPTSEWLTFFREQRLRKQLSLAAGGGHTGRLQERGELLLERMYRLFQSYEPRPSLLHGDLWSGNRATGTDGDPVVFDPAVYYGDRETDLAMTRLFGGFSREFYRAYEAAWPLDEGATARVDLYNLYHVLNHLNLFGAAYRAQAEHMTDRLLANL